MYIVQGETTDDTQKELQAFFFDPKNRTLVEQQIAAYWLVRCECRISAEDAFGRAAECIDRMVNAPECLSVEPCERSNARCDVLLFAGEHETDRVSLSVGLRVYENGERSIRLKHGTKASRTLAWDLVIAHGRRSIQGEVRRLISARAAATIKG